MAVQRWPRPVDGRTILEVNGTFEPGHAMSAIEVLPGTILGKALDGLETGKGTIRVLITLR